ncbi:MAG: hypothetical protein AAF721_41705 [Myxococcota bacterium]
MPVRSILAPRGATYGVSSPLAALLLLAVGCSSTAVENDVEPGEVGGGMAAEDDSGYVDDDDGAGETGGTGEDEPPSGSTGGPDEPPSMDDAGDGAPPLSAGCPEDWPRGWVFCEDFEALDDPLDSFSQYAGDDGAFKIDEGVGAMRAHYTAGDETAGWVLISFGASPIDHGGGTTHAGEEQFDEVYWRVKVKHELGWPDVGPGLLGRASAFATEDWAEALVAQLQSSGNATTLEAVPLTCIADESVACAGFNDRAALQELDTINGETEIFSSALSGEWHCIEAHVRLNEPGAADGVFEFWIDGKRENGRDDIDWRGAWGDYGLNGVTLENFWPGGATADLTRWMDDVVVSREPIGCD